MSSLLPNDYVWEAAHRAMARKPHPALPMHPGCLRGPLKLWLCLEPNCGLTLQTLSDLPPLCRGGFPSRMPPLASQDAL